MSSLDYVIAHYLLNNIVRYLFDFHTMSLIYLRIQRLEERARGRWD